MRANTSSKLALTAVAAGTAATLALAPVTTPVAAAADINVTQDVYTTGPLAGLIAALGVTSIGPITVTEVGSSDVNLTLSLDGPVANDPQTLYDTINNLGFNRRTGILGAYNSYDRVVCTTGGSCSTPNEFPATLGIGTGAASLVQAYRNEIASVQGNTPSGYTSFLPGPVEKKSPCFLNCTNVQASNVTNQALLFVENPLRPNGGIETRFAPILNLFGIDTTVPDAGVYTSTPSVNPPGTGIKINTATLDLTWAYDPLSDFPETLNPFALANTVLAALPTNLLGGVQLEGLDTTAAGLNIAGTLGIISRLSGGILPDPSIGEAFYGTLLPNDLPLLEPLRLPVRLINAISNALGHPLDLGTPLADALQPALSILVNTGYTDVVTPDQGGTYNRTFTTSGDYVPFLSQAPLTPAQWLAVPRNVITALIYGFQKSFPLLRFGQGVPTLTATPGDKFLSITYTPAPTGSAAPKATQSTAVVPDVTTTTPTANTVTVNTTSTGTASSDTTSTPKTTAKPSAAKSKPAAATDQSGSDNSGSGNQAKNTSPSHSAKSAA